MWHHHTPANSSLLTQALTINTWDSSLLSVQVTQTAYASKWSDSYERFDKVNTVDKISWCGHKNNWPMEQSITWQVKYDSSLVNRTQRSLSRVIFVYMTHLCWAQMPREINDRQYKHSSLNGNEMYPAILSYVWLSTLLANTHISLEQYQVKHWFDKFILIIFVRFFFFLNILFTGPRYWHDVTYLVHLLCSEARCQVKVLANILHLVRIIKSKSSSSNTLQHYNDILHLSMV